MKVMLLTLTVCICLCSLNAQDDFRTFTDTQGREIKARILEFQEPNKVMIELENGQRYDRLDATVFSEADQQYIKDWHAAEIKARDYAEVKPTSNLEVKLNANRDRDKVPSVKSGNIKIVYPGAYNVTMEPELSVLNNDSERTFTDVKGEIFLIAKSIIDSKAYTVFSRQGFQLDFPPNERTKWEAKPVYYSYEDGRGSERGYDYVGYVVILYDRSGQPALVSSPIDLWKASPELFMNSSKGQYYNRAFTISVATP
jgi:hypothetical protein